MCQYGLPCYLDFLVRAIAQLDIQRVRALVRLIDVQRDFVAAELLGPALGRRDEQFGVPFALMRRIDGDGVYVVFVLVRLVVDRHGGISALAAQMLQNRLVQSAGVAAVITQNHPDGTSVLFQRQNARAAEPVALGVDERFQPAQDVSLVVFTRQLVRDVLYGQQNKAGKSRRVAASGLSNCHDDHLRSLIKVVPLESAVFTVEQGERRFGRSSLILACRRSVFKRHNPKGKKRLRNAKMCANILFACLSSSAG